MLLAWHQKKAIWYGLLGILALIVLTTAFAPVERTLGERARLVYFHGAWVWVGKITFAVAAFCGIIGLLLPSIPSRRFWQQLSIAAGWAGMFFWATYLPLSLWVQQINWGGIFWDEPRWRIPFMFGVVGALLQIGLFLTENLRISSIANSIFGVSLWWFLGNIQNVLHPDSPIFQSDASRIQLFFILLLVLSILFAVLLTSIFIRYVPERWK